jgi:hypothetical protein
MVIDEIGYLPITRTGAMLFFQIMSRRYEHASTILTSNKGTPNSPGASMRVHPSHPLSAGHPGRRLPLPVGLTPHTLLHFQAARSAAFSAGIEHRRTVKVKTSPTYNRATGARVSQI